MMDGISLYQELDFLHDLIIKQDFQTYDEVLAKINISFTHTTLILGLLRTAFLHKENIPNWNKFLVEAKNELIIRNLDAHKLLRGLL
jgi:hypothetical protein